MIEYITEIIVPFGESVRFRLDEKGTPAVIVMDNFKGQTTPQTNKLLDTGRLIPGSSLHLFIRLITL